MDIAWASTPHCSPPPRPPPQPASSSTSARASAPWAYARPGSRPKPASASSRSPLRSRHLARENIRLNDLEARVRLYETDFIGAANRRACGLVDEAAAVVLTNPPFHERSSVRVSPDPAKALAHVADAPLADWTRAALALLSPGGTFAMIHRAEALGECLFALGGRVGGLAVLPVQPREGAAATRILIRGVKGSKAPLSLLPPLILHRSDGAYAPLADAILRGVRPAPL